MGELANDVGVEVDIVPDSAGRGAAAVVVIGWIEVALGEDEVDVFDAFILWSAGA